MEVAEKSRKKRPVFLIFLGIYAALWVIATIIVCRILNDRFRDYQQRFDAAKAAIDPDAVAAAELYRFDADHITDSLGTDYMTLNRYEAAGVTGDHIRNILEKRTFSCKANDEYTENHPSYDVYADDLMLGTLTLKHRTMADEFGLCDYEFSSLTAELPAPETHTYRILCYAGDRVMVNGHPLEPDEQTILLTDQKELDSYMSRAAAEKSGVSLTECTYTLTDFVNEPSVTLDKYGKTFPGECSEGLFDLRTNYDEQLEYDLNDRLYHGFTVAGEAFICNMNLWSSFAEISKYLEPGRPAYQAIQSAQSGLSWAGRPTEFEIRGTEVLNVVKYDDETLVVTTHHQIHRLYRGVTYDEDLSVEWLYCKNGHAWLIRDFSYL